MGVPQSKWGVQRESYSDPGGERPGERLTARSSDPDEASILKYLKDIATTGDQKLDAILRAIAEAAQKRTGASGAAIAMWKEGAMVCRARSGGSAPPIGAKLNSETGISGECLRTGESQHCMDTENDPRVDVEVCRTLGLRSIAVLPIQGWRGINGILEVFSTEPGTFSDGHLAFLQQLAAVAERARASRPHGATAAVKSTTAEAPHDQGLLPASDRVRDVAAAFLGHRARSLIVLGAVVTMFLIGFVIWLGWRGPAEASQRSKILPGAVSHVEAARPASNDPVWKPDPGGEAVPLKSLQKGSAGIPVQLASKIDVIAPPKTPNDRPLLTADANAVATTTPQAKAAPPVVEEAMAIEPPALPATGSGAAALGSVLGSPVSPPELSNVAISRGVTSGILLHRVSPAYPSQALLLRLQGTVVLEATIFEDGTVHDLKVVKGPPILARPATEAVAHWRYKPYELNGRPIKTKTTITVDFKLPGEVPRR